MNLRDEWGSITGTPKYLTMSDADREQIRQEFYETRIAPNLMPYEQEQGRELFDSFTAPQGDPSSGMLNDLRLAFQSGVAGGFADLAQGATLGHSNTVSDWLRERANDYTLSMSPSMIEDISNTGFTYSKEEGVGIKEGSTVRGAVGLFAQGGGSLAPSVIPGMAASRALSVAGRGLAGTSVAVSAATKANNASKANQAFSRAKLIDSAASATGFGLVGGAMMTGGVASQSYDEVMNLPQETLDELEPYQQRFVELRSEGLTDEQAAQQAREDVAQQASRANLGKAGVIGFLSSALTGPIEAKLLTGAGGATRAGNIARGMATEMAQESVESSAQPYLSNLSVASVGVDRDPWEGVVGETLTGVAIGGGIGGILGGVSKPNPPKSQETLSKEYEGFKVLEQNLQKQLDDPELKDDVKRNQLEMQLGEVWQGLFEIDEQRKNAPTLEQLGESQANETPTPKPAAQTPPSETPDRRNYVPHDIGQQLADAERAHRKINSDYARAMGNKGQGGAETARQFENDLKASNKTIGLLRLLESNLGNQQYFPTEQDFTQYIHRKLQGGMEGRLADIELEARKQNRSVDEAVATAKAAQKQAETVHRQQQWQQLQEQEAQQKQQQMEAMEQQKLEGQWQEAEQAPVAKPKKSIKAVAKSLKDRPLMKQAKKQVAARTSKPPPNTALNIPLGISSGRLKNIGKNAKGETLYQDSHGRRVVQPSKKQFLPETEGSKRDQRYLTADEQQKQSRDKKKSLGRYGIRPLDDGRFVVTGAVAAESARFGKKGYGGSFDKDLKGWVFPNRKRPSVEKALANWSKRPPPETKGKPGKEKRRELARRFYESQGKATAALSEFEQRRQRKLQERAEREGWAELVKEEAQRLRPKAMEVVRRWNKQGKARKEFAELSTHVWRNPETGQQEPVVFHGSDIIPGLDLYTNFDGEEITGRPREFTEITGRERPETQQEREERETTERKKALLEETKAQEEQRKEERQAIIDKQNQLRPYPESEATHQYRPKGGELQLIKPIDKVEIGMEGWYRRPDGKAIFLADVQKRIKSLADIERDKQRQREAAEYEERKEQLRQIQEQREQERLEREHKERFKNEFISPDHLNRFLMKHDIGRDPEASGLSVKGKAGQQYLVDINEDRLTALQLTDYIDAIKDDGFHAYPAIKVDRESVAKITQKNLIDKALIGNNKGNPWNKKHQAEMQLKNKGLQDTHYVSGDDVFWIKKKPDLSGIEWDHVTFERHGALETVMVPKAITGEQKASVQDFTGERFIQYREFGDLQDQTVQPKKGESVIRLRSTNRDSFLKTLADTKPKPQPEVSAKPEKLSTSEKPVKKTEKPIPVETPPVSEPVTAPAEATPAQPSARQERTAKRKRKLLQIDSDLSKAGDDLADVFRKEVGKVGSGVDPLLAAKVLQHGMKVGTLYVQKGAIKFADWADNMLGLMESKGINERDVAPHLKALYGAVGNSEQLTEAQADQMDDRKTIRAFNLETLMVEPAPAEAGEIEGENAPPIPKEMEGDKPGNAPPIQGISGSTATVTVPDTGQKLQVQYKVVENAEVVASHNAKGDLNPDYPAELQPRDRSRQASEEQIHTVAGKWDPDRAVGSVLTSDGAPIVNETNQVESGNGRTLALREVYKTKPKLADQYKQYLIDHAADFGLDPEQIRAMKEPQLVRERQTELTPEQLRDYLEHSNESEVAGKSTTEQATSDAKVLTDDLMASFHPSEKGDLNTAGNQNFLGKFFNAIKGDKASLQTEGGRFSKAFFQRLQGALFAKAYQDNDLINLVLEESTEGVENIVKALNVSAPAFARIQAKHENLQDLNLVPALVQGIRVTREAKAANQAVDEYINQGDILSGETVEPMAALFAQYIDLNKQRHKQLGEAFVTLANMMDQELDRRGEPDIFGERQALSVSDIIKPINQRLKEQGRAGAATSGSLFNAAGRPTEAAQTQESGGPDETGRVADQQRQIEERQAAIAAEDKLKWGERYADYETYRASLKPLALFFSGLSKKTIDHSASLVKALKKSEFGKRYEFERTQYSNRLALLDKDTQMRFFPPDRTPSGEEYQAILHRLVKYVTSDKTLKYSELPDYWIQSDADKYTNQAVESGKYASESLTELQGLFQASLSADMTDLVSYLKERGAPQSDINQIMLFGEWSGGQLKDTRTGRSFSGKTISKNTTYRYAKDWLREREQSPVSRETLPDLDDLLAGTADVAGQLKALNPEAATQAKLETQQKLDTLIQTAADSIDQLRGSDLERLYNNVDYGSEWKTLDHYLRQERPDLETDINLATENLISDQHTGFADKTPTFPGGWQLASLTSEAAGGSEIKISAEGHDFSVRFDPNQNQFILRDRSGMELTAVKDMREAIRHIKDFRKQDHVPGTSERVERDSRQPDTETRQEPAVVQPEPGTEGSGPGGGIRPAAQGRIQPGGSGSVSAGQPAPAGTSGDQSVRQTEQQSGAPGEPSGSPDSGRGRATDATGSPAQRPADQSTALPAQSPALNLTQRLEAQKAAESIPVIRGDLDNIRDTLPVLLPEQQEDVSFIEKRLWEDDERGGMLTNGTGTGKTFSGMGTIKRFVKEGKNNILIVTPSQGINAAWLKAGETMDIDITNLPDIKTAGEGVVVTTYANLGDNNALSGRDWDLIVTDESHNLKESNDFDTTKRLAKYRALTGHPSGAYTKAEMLNPDMVRTMEDLPRQIELHSKSDDSRDWAKVDGLKQKQKDLQKQWREITKQVHKDVQKQWDGKQTKSLMLSATPFAHRKTIDYAEGFLFDYPTDDIQQGYYRQDGQTQFFMSNFGYRFRYGKLTEPDADVDTGLMERQFNQKLKESGAMRSRMLEVEKDYDRKFELVEGGVGADVDAGIKWLDDQSKEARKAKDDKTYDRWYAAHAAINKRLDYHTKAYLMESIKAKAAVPYIQQHLALGRKAVVFHDYNTGGGLNPFQWDHDMAEAATKAGVDPRIAKQGFELIAKQRPDLLQLPLDQLENPRNTFIEAFGDQLVLYSGSEGKKDRAAGLQEFNDDNGSKNVILINSAAGNAGISLHDTTGKHQRLLLNLGIPVRPTFAIQIEGRTYRVGLQSNAMFRYMSTGLTMEKYMVASKLAARAGTAENLAMGNDARALEDSFIEAYQDAAVYAPGMEGEGMGGKARDRQLGGDVSDFDKAKTFYFAKQKRTQKTKAREGRDYFATPEPLGLKVVEWLHAKPGDSLLEPSAGDGAIARWMPDHSTVTAIEPSYELAGQLAMNAPTAKTQQIHFEDLNLQNKYDGIAMNPPYGAASKTAVEHMAKAYRHLRDGGRMIAIIPQGPASETKLNKWLESKEAKDAHVTAEINLPPQTFDRAGTNVNTRILIIDRFNGEQHAVPARRTLDIQADNIKDFFTQIEDLDIGRQRIEKTAEQRSAEVAENPQQWLETKGLEVVDYGSGTLGFRGEATFKFKSILKQQRGIWDGDMKEWTIHGNENTLTDVANAIDNYLTSPLSEYKLLVSEKDGQFLVSGDGTRRHKGLLKEHGAKWDKQAVSWVMESDPTDMLLRELDGSSRYRLADTEAGQIHRKPYETRALTDQINQRVGDIANVVDSVDNLPSHLREQIRNDDLGSRVKGLYDPRTDQVYVIANHAESVRDAVRTAIHEAVGHKGLRGVLGDQINPVLDQIYNSLPDSQLRELREAYANQIAGLPQVEQRRIVAEEYLATLAEDQPNNNFVQRAIAKVRQWLRKVMPNLKWSDSEIRQLLTEASQYARQPADNRPGIDPAGSNPDRVDTPDSARYKLNLFGKRDGQQVRQEIGASARSMKEAVRAKTLGFLGGRQITDIYRTVFDALIVRDDNGKVIRRNPLEIIGDLTQALSATRNEYANKAAKADKNWSKLAGDKRAYQLTAETMHQSTLLKQDPSQDYIPLHDLRELDSQLKSAVLAHDTQAMLDIEAKTKEERQRQKDYKTLTTMYAGMGDLGQQVYNEVRDYYQELWKEQKKALKDRVDGMQMDPDATGKVKAQIEAMFHRDITEGPYFPLMRFGEFGVVARTPPTAEHPDGQPYRGHFESQKDLEAGIRELKSMGYEIESSGKNVQFEPRQMSGITEFSGKIFKALTSEKMDQVDMDAKMVFMDEVNQIALSLLPELSAAKRSMHRKGIAGFDTNARRAFASTVLHGANRLGRTRYGWQIEAELNRMDKATDSGQESVLDETPDDKIIGRSVAEEMRRRHDLNMNPNGHPLAANITSAAFLWYLGGSAAAGMVNLTQNILVALPQLGSKYGYTKASRIMAGAAWDYLTLGKRKMDGIDDILGNAWFTLEGAEPNSRISKDEIDMINALVKDGTIDVTQAHTLANIAGADLRPEAQKSQDWYTKVMRASGMFFHNAEVANRQIAALTSYRLQKDAAAKSNKDFDPTAAIDYTRNAVFDAHFDYSSYNRPRHFKGNWAKVFLIFKQHSQNMSYILGKTFYDGVIDQKLKGTEEGKKQVAMARRALIGTLGLHALFAGVMGLPGMSVMLWAAGKAMGDEDDPVNPEVELRNFFADLFGAENGHALAKGVFNGYLGIDLHARTRLNDLWVSSPNYDMPARQEAMHYVANGIGGPAVSQLINMWVGLNEVTDGETMKGIQRMVPKFLRDGLKTWDYSENGVVDSRGEPIMEQLTPGQKFWQLAGFSPSGISEGYAAKGAITGTRSSIQRRRQQLLNQLDKATRTDDQRLQQKTMAEIERYNEVQRSKGKDYHWALLRRENIRRSLSQRARRREESEQAVWLPQTQLGMRDLGRFALH